jgi:hypothetical protein
MIVRKIAAVMMITMILLSGGLIGLLAVDTVSASPTNPVPTDDSEQGQQAEESEVVQQEEETEVVFAFSDRARLLDAEVNEDEVTLWIETDTTVRADVLMVESAESGEIVTSQNDLQFEQTLSSEGVNKITFSNRDTYDKVAVYIDGERVEVGYDTGFQTQGVDENHQGFFLLGVGALAIVIITTWQVGWLPLLWRKLFPRDLI